MGKASVQQTKKHILHPIFLAAAVSLMLKKWHFSLSNFYAIKVLVTFPRRKHQYFHMINHTGFYRENDIKLY